MANINPKLLAKLLKIRQGKAIWQCTVRRAPLWITPKKQPAYRPFILMVADQDSDFILKAEIISARPEPAAVLDYLFKIMQGNLFTLLKAQRPAGISIDNAELAQACLPQLAELGIHCDFRASLPQVNQALTSFESNMNQREPDPGLLSIPGASVPLVAELFAATAEFYQMAPWRWIENFEPIEVHYPAENEKARYALVLGGGNGEFTGLSLYESLDDLEAIFSGKTEKPAFKPMRWVSLILDAETVMSFADLDAIERFGWPIAGEKAYPLVIKGISGTAESQLPSASELAWLAAALRTIPSSIEKYLRAKRGSRQTFNICLPLPDIHGNQQIALRYPVNVSKAGGHLGQDPDPELEAFIESWYLDENSHEYARQLGMFLLEFLDDLSESGFSDQTMMKHERNCWAIGWLETYYGKHTVFSPDVFLSGPTFIQEYKERISATTSSISSYQTTWRKLVKYVITHRNEYF